MKAAIVVALGLTLLVPTFNALNASYVKDVAPPPWLPTPPTPPDITPPTDFKSPTGMTPPTNYKGKVPPSACPPPVAEKLLDINDTIQGPRTTFTVDLPFKIKNGSIGFEGYINWTQWRASRIFAEITGPQGFRTWNNQTVANQQSGGILTSPTQQGPTSFHYKSYTQNNGQVPKAGSYNLRLVADFPIDGQYHVVFGAALACGGMLSS